MDSRAQFERWCATSGFDVERGNDGDYNDFATDTAWEGWQASRATIEVTLPERVMVEDDYDRGHNYGIEYCEEAIIAAGISIKGESS